MNNKYGEGQSRSYIFRIHPRLIDALDQYSNQHNISRSEALRRAIVAITGAVLEPRKRRSDAIALCELHNTDFQACAYHVNTCTDDSCRCLIHAP